MHIPDTLRYTKNHEWVRVEDNVATIGITDYAQSELGDIVYVDITVGQEVAQHGMMGTIEALKTVSDMFSPLTGTITEVNPELGSNPEKVNSAPYTEGWIAKMSITNPDECDSLLSAEVYREQIGT